MMRRGEAALTVLTPQTFLNTCCMPGIVGLGNMNINRAKGKSVRGQLTDLNPGDQLSGQGFVKTGHVFSGKFPQRC